MINLLAVREVLTSSVCLPSCERRGAATRPQVGQQVISQRGADVRNHPDQSEYHRRAARRPRLSPATGVREEVALRKSTALPAPTCSTTYHVPFGRNGTLTMCHRSRSANRWRFLSRML